MSEVKFVGEMSNAVVEEVFSNWDLDENISNDMSVDVKSAIEEAYMRGCVNAILYKDEAHEALDYFRKN